MATGPVRNPLAGFALASLVSFVLSGVAGFLSMFIPTTEFRLFALGFGLFAIGALASRKVFLGSLGFVGAYLGGFLGIYLTELLLWPNPWQVLLALAIGLAAGIGGFVSGKIGVIRLERMHRFEPAPRRCHNCGERVGMSARKCWSCKASLPA